MTTPNKPTLPHKTRESMNNMYRFTRHIYDATRKYYLLGRDHLIQNINPQPGEHVIEIGCGTARNLRKLGPKHRDTNFYGLDVSDEMLKTAREKINKYAPSARVTLAQGFAQSFIPTETFGLEKAPEKFIFSYALSIIPPWKESIDHAVDLLDPGGEIHIVDFGDQEDLPKFFRTLLFWWLDKFHVYHKPEILDHLKYLETSGQGTLTRTHLYKRYAYYAVFRKT